MKWGTAWVWVLVTFASSISPLFADSLSWKDRVNAVVQDHISAERNVGVIVGVIKDGQTWVQSYGRTRQDDSVTPTEKTIFEIGSVSKAFTGLALSRLAVEGKVQLTDPISKYLPELADRPAGTISLEELSTHTSGLPRLPSNLSPTDPLNPYKNYGESDLLGFLGSFHFTKPKPYPVDYSNVGVGLLGYVLSRVAGVGYEQMIRQLVTAPLGMSDTAVQLSADQLQRTAEGNDSTLEPTPLWDFSVLVGAGGIRSSLEDMMIFLRSNLAPEQTPIGEAIALTHQVRVHDSQDDGGLGWFIREAKTDPMIWHNGQTGGFHSVIAFKPNERVGLVVLTNTAAAIQCVSSIVFGKECVPRKEFAHTDEQLTAFLGVYEFEPGMRIEITKKRSFLIAQIIGQGKIRLAAESEGKFDLAGGLATITFLKNNAGVVDRLVLRQDEKDYVAMRVQ